MSELYYNSNREILIISEELVMSYLKINSIQHQDILNEQFLNLTENNEIAFSNQGIAVVYGPNGTGKTTLAKAFSCIDNGSHFNIEYNGVNYNDDKELFHIIEEQKNRNIIKGDTQDFILGDDIRREYELKAQLEEQKNKFIDRVIETLKSFGITTKSNLLFELLNEKNYKNALQEIANKKNQGKDLTYAQICDIFSPLIRSDMEEDEEKESKLHFLTTDYSNKQSIIKKIEEIVGEEIQQNTEVVKIEQNDDAIEILEKYAHLNQCIVCDNPDIHPEEISHRKQVHRQRILDLLNEKIKKIIESIKGSSLYSDPFNIKSTVIRACDEGDSSIIEDLFNDINNIKIYFIRKLENRLLDDFDAYNIQELNDEYEALIERAIELTTADECYIKQIIQENIRSNLEVRRDNNRNIRIFIDDNELLENELPLSTGEQNFISLSFELLKAKNNHNSQVVVLDDPISSFDSIYKNKIIFAIIKILENKDNLILTHNIDVLRLLDAQYNGCFNLYMLYNIQGQNVGNGFVKVNDSEKGPLLNLHKLICFFRHEAFPYIRNYDAYFRAIIPFMRGYANLLPELNNNELLTNLMHGYKTAQVNVKDVYNRLFGNEIDEYFTDNYELTATSILDFELTDDIDIIDSEHYPLINQTLKHSLIFLQARLLVEKTLVEKYHIDTDTNKQLGQIIDSAFPRNNNDTLDIRISLTSKKTLINEFNHFEGNLSLFQPAIDISHQALLNEYHSVKRIMERVENL